MLGILINYFLIVMLTTNSAATLNNDLVGSFFKHKHLRFGYIFHCASFNENIGLTKYLMEYGIRVSMINIKQDFLTLINHKSPDFYHTGIIIDGYCNNVNDFLEQPNISLLFTDVYHWLIIASNYSFLNRFPNLPLNINSDLFVAIPHENNLNEIENWTINDVYNPAYKHGGDLKIQNIGTYSINRGFTVNQKGFKYWARKNMTGVTLKTMVVLQQSFDLPLDEYFGYDTNRKNDSFTRFQYQLIQTCRELFNFSLQVNITKTWGYEYEGGQFDGLSGALQRKEVDLGSSALYIKPDRISIMDFATGFWEFREIYVFRQPQRGSFVEAFLYSMTTSAWLTTIAVTLLVLILLKYSQNYEVNILKRFKCPLDHKWSTVILFTLGAICQQGSPQTPNLAGGRMITLSVLTFYFLFYQFYSGAIVSSLLVKPQPTIKNLEDLLKGSLKVGCDDAPYIKDIFQTTTDPAANELYRRKILNEHDSPNYFKPEDGLKLVAKGGFSYQVESTIAYIIIQNTFSNKAICELGEIESFPPRRLMTVLQKHSPFRDLFNYCMLRLGEHGIGAYQKDQSGARKPHCLESSSSITIEVDLKQIYPAIAILSIGILISLAVLAIEISMKIIRKNKIKNKYFYKQ